MSDTGAKMMNEDFYASSPSSEIIRAGRVAAGFDYARGLDELIRRKEDRKSVV